MVKSNDSVQLFHVNLYISTLLYTWGIFYNIVSIEYELVADPKYHLLEGDRLSKKPCQLYCADPYALQ